MVKVPEMAESISEGTLKQWSKQIGDQVEQDEEIATIETDKIDVSVNAPQAGVLKELMAKEEETVTVGQEIAKLDGGAEGVKKAETGGQEPKSPAASEQPTSSQPSGKQEQEAPKEQKEEMSQKEPEDRPSPPPQQPPQQQQQQQPPPSPKQPEQPKPQPPKQQQQQPQQPAQPQKQQQPQKPKEEPQKPAPPGSREERRVGVPGPPVECNTHDTYRLR